MTNEFERNSMAWVDFISLFPKSGTSNVVLDELRISNLTVNEESLLTGYIFEKSLSFEDITFQESLVFEDCVFYAFTLENIKVNKKLHFKNCIVHDIFSFRSLDVSELILNEGSYCPIVVEGVISSSNNSLGSLIFEGGHYKEIQFKAKQIDHEIQFSKGSFNNVFFIRNNFLGSIKVEGDELEFDGIYFQSCDLKHRIDILKATLKGGINFHKVNFQEQVVIGGELCAHSLSFTNINAKQDISVGYAGNFGWLTLSDCKFDNVFQCTNNVAEEIVAGTEELTCHIDGTIYGTIIIERISTPTIWISSINFGTIIFNEVETQNIELINFNNYNKLIINNPKFTYNQRNLFVVDSNLNATEFVNIDFRKFNELVIARSEVSNIVLSNSILPAKIQIEAFNSKFGFGLPKEERINDNIYYRETYRQLKIAMEKQGSIKSALTYKAKEMYHLRKEQSFGWDWLLLYLNYLSNNHGTNWFKGVIFTIITSYICFVLYQCAIPNSLFQSTINIDSQEIFDTFLESLDSFIVFLTSFPLYKEQLVFNSWKVSLIILISRIAIGYGVYQTIFAFRKYSK